MDKISVIIPIYNVEKYIAECLNSTINQTHKNLEIICVDDCGCDNSIKIAEEFAQKDGRIKIIHHEQNKGLAPARNTGLDAASGDYIFFLDSDDYILPDILEKMYNKITGAGCDFVDSSAEAFPDNPENEEQVKKAEKTDLLYKGYDNYKVTPENFEQTLVKLHCLTWGKLFKSEFLKDNNIRFVDTNAAFEDNGFFLKILSCQPEFSTLRDTGVMYRVNSASITSNMNKDKNRELKKKHLKIVMDDALNYMKTKKDGDKLFKILKNSGAFNWQFRKKSDKFFKLSWGKHNKKVIFFGIPLVREKMLKKNKKILKFLGIPISYTNIDSSVL